MLSVEECWKILERYASKTSAGAKLPSGASLAAIVNAESMMGVEFPDDLRDLLLRHNGSGPFFIYPYKNGDGQQWFLGLDEILNTWKLLSEVGADFEKDGKYGEQSGPIKNNYWNNRWIPFTDNSCGDNIFVDLNPDEQGTLGQIVDWWHEGGVSTLEASSLCEWLNEIVEELHEKIYVFRAGNP